MFRTTLRAAIVVVTFCLLARLAIIGLTPSSYPVDLAIYAATGQLVSNGVNPYDATQGRAIRLRVFDYHTHTLGWKFPSSLESWNQYEASNLPLSEALFGAVYLIHPSPNALRITFALGDSAAVLLIFLVVLRRWSGSSRQLAAAVALVIGLNPAFLLWGTIYPEDKGIQTLLLMGVLLASSTSLRPPSKIKLALAGVLTAASITYKGFGIFLVPAVVKWARDQLGNTGAMVAAAAVTVGTALIVLPFVGAVTGMSIGRTGGNTLSAPGHSSIWVVPYQLLPMLQTVRVHLILGAIMSGVVVAQVVRRQLSLDVAGGLLVGIAAVVVLVQGSLDRMMIGIVTVIVVLGMHRTSWGITACAFWLAAGTMAGFLADDERSQGLVVLVAIFGTMLVLTLGLDDAALRLFNRFKLLRRAGPA